MNSLVIYGATGYVGRLVAQLAVRRGLRPVLAGRDLRRLAALRIDAPVRAASLADPAALDRLLVDASVLLNAAGPFAETQRPLLDACLRTGTHYLDLSGEAAEFLDVRGRDDELVRAGVMAMPGVGFGVVPTDAVAVHLAGRLPLARRLELSFVTSGQVSRGTLGTLLAGLGEPGVQRRDGRLVPVRAGAAQRGIPADGRTVRVVTNPWRADVVSAGQSTGIPDVSTFFAVPAPLRLALRVAPAAPWLLTSPAGRRLRAALLRRIPEGPTPAQLDAGRSLVHGLATDDAGTVVEAVLTGPDPYRYSAYTAVELLARTAAGTVRPGYRTPAQVHGPDVALTTPGTVLRDLR
ncbi:saccharopine dehydrogenase NADP-binding domain-containing protein [Micromonospora sp. R77]|uniref:saccharopine dehydrogenase family protein n=1 Tax=Micromonospora sp. R77 TaxID=2925836 RepID=UPI001F6257E9|nr:saccharopine dehydrogenase NADP-binding domain-containing protein [Micromonospora sp. R77]MCI4066763.1 saccharopine dehydrogenase NADP-binding domain-containing protein [Micromonospora sp. R77]